MPDTRRALSSLQTIYADNTAGDISAQDLRDGVQSMHGEKLVQTDTQANEPAVDPLAGDLFLPNNGFQVERYSGSAWVPWGPLFPLTKPVSGDFAWINQGGASVTTTNGGVYLSAPADAAINMRIRKKAAPSAPYTITALILPNVMHFITTSYPTAGLVFRQSSDGKMCSFHVNSDTATGAGLNVTKWTDHVTFSAHYKTQSPAGLSLMHPLWLRIADDNTNRICSLSSDGVNFSVFHSVGRTDFLTADEVGFFTDARNASFASGILLLSWKEG